MVAYGNCHIQSAKEQWEIALTKGQHMVNLNQSEVISARHNRVEHYREVNFIWKEYSTTIENKKKSSSSTTSSTSSYSSSSSPIIKFIFVCPGFVIFISLKDL
jgi:hypothetical protein